jgi:hypothetical protein
MARKRRTFKEAVTKDAGYAHWVFGDNVRDVNRDAAVAKLVSSALKNVWNKWDRRKKAQAFAKRMWAAYWRVKDYGCRKPGSANIIPRDVLNAMCWGVSSGHSTVMIQRYKAAAQAAERFCR